MWCYSCGCRWRCGLGDVSVDVADIHGPGDRRHVNLKTRLPKKDEPQSEPSDRNNKSMCISSTFLLLNMLLC